jgi:hypothetical protein
MARTARVTTWLRPTLAFTLGLLLLADGAFASRTARTISTVASGVSVWHGLITLVAPNPVTGVISVIYGAIGFGAAIYDGVVDPPPAGPPVIEAIVAGPATDRDRATWELIAAGAPVEAAPAGRIVSIRGANFSFIRGENVVTFDGQPAVLAPQTSNTLLPVAVPLLAGPLPRPVTVQVTVSGVASAPFSFTVEPPGEPGKNVDRVLEKLERLTARVRGFDWEALLDQESPGLPQDRRGQALGAAQQMLESAEDALPQLAAFRDLLAADPEFRQANEVALADSPEIEALIDAGLAALDAAEAP